MSKLQSPVPIASGSPLDAPAASTPGSVRTRSSSLVKNPGRLDAARISRLRQREAQRQHAFRLKP